MSTTDDADLERSTPCKEWDVRALINHMAISLLFAAAIVRNQPPPVDRLGTVRGYIEPAELILDGEFGIPGALHGRLIVSLHPDATGTVITFTHTAIGPIPADGTTAHERGWATLLERLCTTAARPHAIR